MFSFGEESKVCQGCIWLSSGILQLLHDKRILLELSVWLSGLRVIAWTAFQ